MRDEDFPTFSELRHRAKTTWNQQFESDEACFLDAFLHGEYHEESTDFISLTEGLSKRQLISLFLPVCHAMIAGSVHHREESPSLKVLMDCFSALERWAKTQLRKPDDILLPLAEVRKLVFKEVIENKGNSWWGEVLQYFEMLEAGIYRRMGVHQLAIDSEYKAMKREFKGE